MRRKFLIGAASFLGLILILAIAVFWYIRSGRLDRYIQGKIVEALAEFGIRAEIEKTHLSITGYTVTLDNINLYAGDAQDAFGKIDNIKVSFSVLSYLKQRINITEVTVTHPQVWVAFDKDGKFNLAALHGPPNKQEAKEAAITFLSAYVYLKNGALHYNDQLRDATAEIEDFNVDFTPKNAAALEDKINHALSVSFTKANAKYQGRAIERITSNITADVTEKDASVTKFELDSDVGKATATARIPSFDPFTYETNDLRVDTALEQVSRVFMPDAKATGNISFTGKVSGTGDQYTASGTVESSGEVSAAGFTLDGIRITASDVSGKGDKYKARAEITSGGVRGRDLLVGAIHLKDATVSGEGAKASVEDSLSVASVKSGRINVSNINGNLSADRERVGLSSFTASALGGTVSGSASVAIDGGSSKVDAVFKSIDLAKAAELASQKDVQVKGSASGNVSLAFPGTNYRAATGRINSTFDASITRPEATEPATAKGEISLAATGNGFNIQKAYVRSANSDFTATGTVGWNGAASLNINFKSEDMAEVQRVISALGLLSHDVEKAYPIELSGPGSFTGRLQGKLSSPSLSGHLSLSSISTKSDQVRNKPGELLGALEADFSYSPSLAKIENGSLVRSPDSRIDFNINAPLQVKDSISVQANVQNYEVATLASLRIPNLKETIGQGTVSGTIDLRGLPGPRTIEGTAHLAVTGGELAVPGKEGEDQTNKVALKEFTGDISLANSVVTVSNVKLGVGNTEITGQGSFNLDTYAYTVNAGGQNIDLSQVADWVATDESRPNISGTADLSVTGQGYWGRESGKEQDWTGLDLNATIQGHNITFNGREFGDAKIVATTNNGELKVEATANVLDQMRTIAATINLRDRNWPVNASIAFTDTDIGPYLGLVAPELSGVTGKATGSITISGPLQKPGEGLSIDGIEAKAVITHLELGGNISEKQRYTITNQGDIVVTATAAAISIQPVTFVGESTSLTIEGTIAREGGKSNLTANGEINLKFLSSFTPSVFTTGIAGVQASIEGTLDSPQLRGIVNLRDVGVRVVDFPLSIARGSGQIRFTVDQALLENFTAAAPGGGSINITGGAALAGLVPERWRLDVAADQVGIEFPRDTQTVFDAQLALQGNRRIQVLSGDIVVRRSSYTREITIEELITTGGPFTPDALELGGPGGAGGGGGGSTPITLDLRVTADNTLVIKNNLADAVASAFLSIRGPAEDPVISGRVQVVRGTLEFRRGRFELTRGIVTLPGRRRSEPILDIQSEADISGYHLEVSFTGEVSRLQTIVRSEPQLPEADIISLVLTGNVSGDASTQASMTQTGLGLAQSILSASLSEQLESRTQRLFGISRFSIDPLLVGRGNDPTARITIGQRITKDLTVTYSQNLTSGPSGIDRVILVEYRLSNRFSIVGLRNERGELGFDVRLRKRF